MRCFVLSESATFCKSQPSWASPPMMKMLFGKVLRAMMVETSEVEVESSIQVMPFASWIISWRFSIPGKVFRAAAISDSGISVSVAMVAAIRAFMRL